MALVFTSLGTQGDTNQLSAYTCNLIRAPNPNTLVLIGVVASDAVGTAVQPVSVAGAGLTFEMVGSSITYNPSTVGSQLHNLSLWRAMGTAPNDSQVTATLPNAGTGCAITVTEVSGVSKAGTNGDKAVSSSTISFSDGTASLTVWTPSATSTADGWFSVVGLGGSVVHSNGDWISVTGSAVSYATPGSLIQSGYTTSASANSVRWLGAGGSDRGGVLTGIVADNPTGQAGGQWAQAMVGTAERVFPPRTRSEFWVESGHGVNLDPATDTREG